MLSQWEILDPAEKIDIQSRLKIILDNNEVFIFKLLDLWKKNHASVNDLKKILSANMELWPRLQKYF